MTRLSGPRAQLRLLSKSNGPYFQCGALQLPHIHVRIHSSHCLKASQLPPSLPPQRPKHQIEHNLITLEWHSPHWPSQPQEPKLAKFSAPNYLPLSNPLRLLVLQFLLLRKQYLTWALGFLLLRFWLCRPWMPTLPELNTMPLLENPFASSITCLPALATATSPSDPVRKFLMVSLSMSVPIFNYPVCFSFYFSSHHQIRLVLFDWLFRRSSLALLRRNSRIRSFVKYMNYYLIV